MESYCVSYPTSLGGDFTIWFINKHFGVEQKGFVGSGGTGTKPPKTEAELRTEYNSRMADYDKSVYEGDPAVKHAVFRYAEEIGSDVVKVVDDIIDRFKRCIS